MLFALTTASGCGTAKNAAAPTASPRGGDAPSPSPSVSVAVMDRRNAEGFAGCKTFDPSDGYPDDASSPLPDPVLSALHAHCAATLDSDGTVRLDRSRWVVLAIDWPTADAQSRRIYFFEDNRFVAVDDAKSSHQIQSVAKVGADSVEAQYASGGEVTAPRWSPVRFEWKPGGRPHALDPLPAR